MNERECLLPTIRVGCDGAYFNFQNGVFLGGPLNFLQHRIRLVRLKYRHRLRGRQTLIQAVRRRQNASNAWETASSGLFRVSVPALQRFLQEHLNHVDPVTGVSFSEGINAFDEPLR